MDRLAVGCPIHRYPTDGARSLGLDPVLDDALEQDQPVRLEYPHGGQCWLVTRYDDVRTVYSSKIFSRSGNAPRITASPLFAGGLATMDDAVHLKVRRIVTAELNRRMGSIRSSAESIMTERLSPLREGVGIDYVADVAKPYSIRVLGELLRIPTEDDANLIGWVCALLADDFVPNAEANAESAVKDMGRYVMELVTARGENLGDDVVSDFIRHDGLSYLDVVTIVFGLIIAGFESTAHMLSKMVFQLLIRPDLWSALQENPDRIPGAVEELLRTISLGGGEAIPWLVREPISLGGMDMAAGDYVMPSTGAANRDGLVFEDPDQIVFGRSQKQHLTFGYGTSYCLGSQVAKVELEVGLSTIFREYPTLQLAVSPEGIRWPSGSAVWQLAELPVSLA